METKPAPGDPNKDSGTDDEAKQQSAYEHELQNHQCKTEAHMPKQAAPEGASEAAEAIAFHSALCVTTSDINAGHGDKAGSR